MDSAALQDAAIVSADEAVNGNGALDSAASESGGAQLEPQEEDLKGTELIGVLEALLFVSTEPVPVSGTTAMARASATAGTTASAKASRTGDLESTARATAPGCSRARFRAGR